MPCPINILHMETHMLVGHELVLVADGASARFFERRTPESKLAELTELHMTIGHHSVENDRATRAFDRMGSGRHAVERRLTSHEADEQAFLVQISDRLNAVIAESRFEHLVVCAPPKALGLLRSRLVPQGHEKLVLSIGKDISKERIAEIDDRLRKLRA
jgi:protein required for attachment to host cells